MDQQLVLDPAKSRIQAAERPVQRFLPFMARFPQRGDQSGPQRLQTGEILLVIIIPIQFAGAFRLFYDHLLRGTLLQKKRSGMNTGQVQMKLRYRPVIHTASRIFFTYFRQEVFPAFFLKTAQSVRPQMRAAQGKWCKYLILLPPYTQTQPQPEKPLFGPETPESFIIQRNAPAVTAIVRTVSAKTVKIIVIRDPADLYLHAPSCVLMHSSAAARAAGIPAGSLPPA